MPLNLCEFCTKVLFFFLYSNEIRFPISAAILDGIEAIRKMLDNNIKISYLCGMTQLTLSIADNHLKFFLELIKKFDFVKIEQKSDIQDLTNEQKSVLENRLKTYINNPETYLDLKDVKNNIRKRYEV